MVGIAKCSENFLWLQLSTSTVEKSAQLSFLSFGKQNHKFTFKLYVLDFDKKNGEKTWEMMWKSNRSAHEGWKYNEESIFRILAPKAYSKF